MIRTLGFREEEVNDRDPRCVERTVDDEVPPADICECYGCDFGDEEVEQPRHSRRNPADLGSLLCWSDLAGI